MKTITLVLIISVVLLTVFAFVLVYKALTKDKKDTKRASIERSYESSTQTFTTGRYQRTAPEENYEKGYTKTDFKDDEYTRLLVFFGLDDSASEEDIKKSYREKMKALHPDRHSESKETNPLKFQELKEAYDRIMEIRSGWFGNH